PLRRISIEFEYSPPHTTQRAMVPSSVRVSAIRGLPLRPEAATPMPARKEPTTTADAVACRLPHLPAGATSHASNRQIFGPAHTTRGPGAWVGSPDRASARAWGDTFHRSRFGPTRRRSGGTPDREPDCQRERGDDPAR